MARKRAAMRRVKYEICVMAALFAALAAVLFWRGRIPAEEDGATMLEWKPGKFVAVEYGTGLSNDIDVSGFSDVTTKTGADLVIWAEMAWENQWGYVWGTFGDVLSEGLLTYKLGQYPTDVGGYEDIIREKWMDRRTVDCTGLIKSYGWYDGASGSIRYGANGMPDCGTDEFYDAATVKGPIETLPERPGVILYAKGHVGVYVGGGWCVEAISTAGGVVKTKVSDRTWTDWLECPYIRYDS